MKLEIQSVDFSYGEKQIFGNVNLKLSSGNRVAIMGPSGAGKTTLLHLMAGLLRPERGQINGIPDRIGMVFQEDRLLSQISILKNVAFAAPAAGETIIHFLLGQVGLELEADSRPEALSGGMKRRVAIVRAVAAKSPLLLLDEPFSGMDEQTKELTARFILRNAPESILVAATHDEQEAALLDSEIIPLASLN